MCGTGSDAGKSAVVAGLCRLLARRGVAVAPFKAQNMALNSWVTDEGTEIGRAQAVQALAAGAPPETAMNPILLKPTGERTSQVVLMGRPWKVLDAAGYHAAKPELAGIVADALESLRARYEVVICEGAGSPTEINLLDHDLVNLRLAAAAGIPAVVVGDIDRGGVFASLYGTVALLPDDLRPLVRGFLINKFRGDPALLTPGLEELEARTGVPVLGVLPWIDGLGLDAEDSLALAGPDPFAGPVGDDPLDVAVIRFPRISNFTDLDPLGQDPACEVRLVDRPGTLGDPDLIVLPGTKSTLADLAWLRAGGLAGKLAGLAGRPRGPVVLGICGGYQMLGDRIFDGIESDETAGAGLGLLPVETVFGPEKVTRRRRGRLLGGRDRDAVAVSGYQIHQGRVGPAGPGDARAGRPWLALDDGGGGEEPEGWADPGAALYGTSLHGLFEEDGFRTAFLGLVADHRGKPRPAPSVEGSFAGARLRRFDRLADALETHVDLPALLALIASGAPLETAQP